MHLSCPITAHSLSSHRDYFSPLPSSTNPPELPIPLEIKSKLTITQKARNEWILSYFLMYFLLFLAHFAAIRAALLFSEYSQAYFCHKSFVLAPLSFLQVIGSDDLWPPTKKAFLPLSCSLSPYLAPLLFRTYSCLKLSRDLYTHTSHSPTRVLKAGTLLVLMLPGSDTGRKSVNVL